MKRRTILKTDEDAKRKNLGVQISTLALQEGKEMAGYPIHAKRDSSMRSRSRTASINTIDLPGDEFIPSLSINLSKSKLLGVVVSEDRVVQAANRISCGVLKAPFAYLGSKVGKNISRIKSWDEIVDKMVDRLSKWKMKTLSIGGRLTLLKGGVLGSVPHSIICYIHGAKESLQRMEQFERAIYLLVSDLNSKKLDMGEMEVIKAIHGEDGKNGSGFKVGYKSIWRSILQEMWLLKLSQENLTWSFRRAPRSGVEQDQLTDLTTYVEGVVLGVTPDRWYWYALMSLV
ncbi:hypothetical protein Tco_0995705 [Tanacetum coccineum]